MSAGIKGEGRDEDRITDVHAGRHLGWENANKFKGQRPNHRRRLLDQARPAGQSTGPRFSRFPVVCAE